jgi:hypothetical protein
MRSLVTELAEYVSDSLEAVGVSRFAFPLFRPSNALFALTADKLLCVGSPLSGGVASLRFLDLREKHPSPTLEQLVNDVGRQLGWIDTFSFQTPSTLLSASTEAREGHLRQLAGDFAARIRAEVQHQQRRVILHPIFQTQPENMELDDQLCFVLMPFQAAFNRLFQNVIEPVIKESGLKPLRADQVFSPTPVVEDIWVHIATARLLVADVTGKNPNVFYELGVAHTVGKPVIVIAQNKADVPFDIAYIRYFLYADDEQGWKKLRSDLESAIAAALSTS